MDMLKSLWQYRGFIFSSIRNEFKSRFIRSRLGGLWMIIHPLVQVAIYALILSNLLAAKLPGVKGKYAYAVYLVAGTIGWTLFSEIITRSLSLFIAQGNLIKKMRFPRITLPAIMVGSSLTSNFLLIIASFGVFLLIGNVPGFVALWLLPLTIALVAFALGLGLILGVLNVFMRDIGHVVPIVLQILFWFTPVVYPATVIPAWLLPYMKWNPMFHFINAYHDILCYGHVPQLLQLVVIVLTSMVLLVIGVFIFRRASAELVDAL